MQPRRKFIKQLAIAGAGSGLATRPFYHWMRSSGLKPRELKLGIVGLSPHSAAFSTLLNDEKKESDLAGCRIVTLFHPPGNPDVEFSTEQLSSYRQSVEKAGVKIVSTMEAMMQDVDGVLIETNDGRPHMEQVLPVIKAGKPVFVDKPVAEDLKGVIDIYNLGAEHNVPIFSSSSLRYGTRPQEINQSKKSLVLGANTFSPAPLEPGHTDLYWYGIHGVEMLYTVMGAGCQEVWQVGHSDHGEVVAGVWDDGRIGTFRGIRAGRRGYGGSAFLEDEIIELGSFEGYRPLVVKIVEFFLSGQSPVPTRETLEIYAFMTAAHISNQSDGQKVNVQDLLKEFKLK